ncbi:MAG: hypothetical protein IID37_13170, partial [Planctomycetes bacterium]|nr:hypothetical protein [Planctomycetota bacterium]
MTASRKTFPWLPAICGLALATGSVAWAEVINVPGDFATIQAAIDAAINGDEVVVAADTYVENVDFLGKDITVRSTDPLDPDVVGTTIIDGGGIGTVVVLSTGEISGFTITGGVSTGAQGGGVDATGGAVVSHNVITANVAG